MYTETFIKIYNLKYKKLVDKIHRMIKLEKYSILRAENFLNLDGGQFQKISNILKTIYIGPRDTKGHTFYLNNYIDRDK